MFNNLTIVCLGLMAFVVIAIFFLIAFGPRIEAYRKERIEKKRLADMPAVYITDNNNITSVATEAQMLQAEGETRKKIERGEIRPNGMYILPVICDAMLFSSAKYISASARENLTGTSIQLRELLKGCQVKHGDHFVFFSSVAMADQEWQQKNFRRTSLVDAYRRIHGSLDAARRRGCNNPPSGSFQTGCVDVV